MDQKSKWTYESIPDLSGKIVVITGANSGLGQEVTKMLLKRSAKVIIANKNFAKSFGLKSLFDKYDSQLYDLSILDLSDLVSIKKFSERFKNKFDQLDILINNAAIMNPPYCETKQGFEMQFGVNHLGHFALCGQLMDVLTKTPKSRVVTVSSNAAHDSPLDILTLSSKDNYDRKIAYKKSKLSNLLFSLELDRRFKEYGMDCISVAVHPGYSKSNLQRHSKGLLRKLHIFYTLKRFGQSAEMGALSILRAATEKGLIGKEYFHPDADNELTGYPIADNFPSISTDRILAKQLWQLSQDLTKIEYLRV